MHRVSRSIVPTCWDDCELPVFEYQGWPYEWPYSHLMSCVVWLMLPFFVALNRTYPYQTSHAKWAVHYLFRGVECLMRMDHLEWYFAFTMDFRRLVSHSPSISKKHWPEITKQMVRYLYDRLQKPPSRHWLFWLSYSLTVGQKQLHMSPEKVWPQKVLDRLSLSWNRWTIEHMLVMVHGTLQPILHCISKSFIWLFVCVYAS